MPSDPLIYSETTGYIKGINLPGQKWEFHKRWMANPTSRINMAKKLVYKEHEGGWELNGKPPTPEQNERMSFFYAYNMVPHKFTADGTLLINVNGVSEVSERDAWSYVPGTVYFYFGDSVEDGDYPRGRLSDEALLLIDPTNLNTIPIVKLVPDPYTFTSKWKSITLRPEDFLFARTGIREPLAPAPESAPERRAVEIPAGFGASSAIAGFGRRRGGVRKTKARRSVKKRRTARR